MSQSETPPCQTSTEESRWILRSLSPVWSFLLILHRRPHQMDPTVAPVLLFALCVGMGGTGAARPGSLRSVDVGAGGGERPVNNRVVLHDYMVFLYRTLIQRQPRDMNDSRGLASTVTSFVDQGKGWIHKTVFYYNVGQVVIIFEYEGVGQWFIFFFN